MTFAPESGNMLGGTIVNVTGPCFEPGKEVKCIFENVEIDAKVIDVNRAICIQPLIYGEGYIPFSVKIGSETYRYQGKYFLGKDIF